jgi:prolipoprotein diacylglyceryl transferase
MIHWDPRPEIFTIPGVNWPILWYGVFFALGFAVGFPLFVSILKRFFLDRPEYTEADILQPEELIAWGKSKAAIAKALNEAMGRGAERARARLTFDERFKGAVLSVKKKAVGIADRLTVYMIIGTVAGARLGHFLFYERPSDYLSDPFEIFRIWEGGLASHGGAIGIVIALALFSLRIRKSCEELTWVRLLDFVSIPAAFGAFCIRIGNFFNQEILGKPTNLPWAVVFGHPADHSLPAPRHPVQLYEAAVYLLVFFLLWFLSRRPRFLLTRGKLVGLFLILVFGFRFCVEFLKLEQSHLLSMAPFLTMGQILSIPAVAAGVLLFFWKRSPD